MIALMLLGGLALYLVIAAITTKALMRRVKTKRIKRLIGVASVLVFLFVPIWDEIAGRIYLYRACAMEGGVRVYKTVQLDPTYWDKDGRPSFVTSYQNKPTVILNGQYKFVDEGYKPYSEIFNLKKYQLKLIKIESHEELGAYTKFAFGGGWVLNRVPAHYSAVICPLTQQYDSALITAVFLKK